MEPTLGLVLGILLLFQLKHLVADFLLQNTYILQHRGSYGHPGGLLHTGIHLVGSVLILALAGTPGWLFAALIVVEGLVHYHTDWLKDNYTRWRGLTTADPLYWFVLGFDQAVHQATYVGVVWFWALNV